MRVFLIITILFISGICYAGISNMSSLNWTLLAPPKNGDIKGTYDYMYSLYSHFNQLQTTTIDPGAVRNTNIGNMILYNNSGTYKLCVETNNPSGTVWKCATLS